MRPAHVDCAVLQCPIRDLARSLAYISGSRYAFINAKQIIQHFFYRARKCRLGGECVKRYASRGLPSEGVLLLISPTKN